MGVFDDIYSESTPSLMLVAMASSLGAITYGFDSSWWSGVLGETAFGTAFGEVSTTVDGVTTKTLSTPQTSAGSGLSTAGIIIGCIVAAPLNKILGRRKAMALIGVVSLVGVILEAAASTGMVGRYWQLIVGRIIASIAIGMASNIVPVYQAEAAPKKMRGCLVGFYSVTQNVSAFLATCVIYKVNTWDNSAAWLVPICVQFLTPVLIIGCYFIIPESPRWLVMEGRIDEARQVLAYLRRKDSDVDSELAEMKAGIEEQLAMTANKTYWDLFKGSNTPRTMVRIGLQCLANAMGVSYIVNYAIVLFEQLGLDQPYLILIIIYVVYAICAATSFYLPDRVGRRPLLLVGGMLCAIAMLVIGGITTKWATPTGAAANTVIAMVFLWCIGYAATWGPMGWLMPSELPTAALRELTMSVASTAGYCVSLIITFVSPYIQDAGYGNLGGRIGFIWGAFSVAAILFVWLWVPETRNIELETLDALYEAGIAGRKFASTTLPQRHVGTEVGEKDDAAVATVAALEA